MDIKVGLVFTGKWFTGRIEVIEVKEDTNEIEVKLSNDNDNWWFETWNLQHTLWGFRDGDYFLERGLTIDTQKEFKIDAKQFIPELSPSFYSKSQSKFHK